MTKQDKKYQVKIGPIKFYGGYQSNPVKKLIYPPERLSAFLNVNTNKYAEIRSFCNLYVFLPPKIYSSGLKEAFKEEQQKLLRVYKNYKKYGRFSDKDLVIINSYLELTKPKVLETKSSNLKSYNKYIATGETNLPDKNGGYLIKVFKSNAISTLWEDFVNQVLNSQKLGECLNCGKFYTSESFHKRKFCCDDCGDAHRKKVKRAKST